MRTASCIWRVSCSTAVPPRPKSLPAGCSLSSLQPFFGSHILRSPFSEDSSHPSLLLSSVVRLGSLRTAFSPLFSLLAAQSPHKNSGALLGLSLAHPRRQSTQVTSVPFWAWPSGRRPHSPTVSTVWTNPRGHCTWLHYSTFQSVPGLALGMVQRAGKSPAVWPYG